MASQTVRHIIDLAKDLLQDEGNDRWEDDDLVNWYNASQRDIVTLRPDANPVIDAIKLASGTRQVIPARGVALIDVLRNMGTDGATPGNAVIKTDIETMKAFNLGWNSETAAAAINEWIMISPTQYYVSPPSDGTGYIEMVFSQIPEAVVWDEDGNWESNLIGVKENFVNATLYDILYFSFVRDTDVPSSDAKAMRYKNQFFTDLGITPQTGMTPTEQPQ